MTLPNFKLKIVAKEPIVNTITANFSANKITAESDEVINFTDLSTGTPTNWGWDFNGEALSSVQNPSTSFKKTGQKTITLLAAKNGAGDVETKSNYINIVKTPANFGTIFTDDFNRTVLGTEYIIAGATTAMTGNRLNLSNAFTTTYGNRVERNYWHCHQVWEQTMRFRISATPTTTTFGVGMGMSSILSNDFSGVNGYWDLLFVWHTFTGSALSNKIVTYPNRSSTQTLLTESTTTLSPVVGRDYTFTITKTLGVAGAVYTGTITDTVTLASISTSYSEDVSLPNNIAGRVYNHKAVRPFISTLGMPFSTDLWQLTSTDKKKQQYLVIGDSITWGLNASNAASAFSRSFDVDNEVIGGPSMSTRGFMDMLNTAVSYNPDKLVLAIGFNDCASSPAGNIAQLQANYQAIINAFTPICSEIILMKMIRNTSGNFQDFNNWIDATYPSFKRVSNHVGMTTSADNVHPDNAGHILMRNNLQAVL
jgi:PKD repeat protein/lysophospholipase L1-like esterase